MGPTDLRFAADAMLHLLAKWLRLLGYDCAAGPNLFGRRLIELAVAERRWVLTRNYRLSSGVSTFLLSRADVYLLKSECLPDQLFELTERFSIDVSTFLFTRCIRCNEPLVEINRSEASGAVPSRVLDVEKHFFRCSRCGRAYWHGSHAKNSMRRIRHWLDRSGKS